LLSDKHLTEGAIFPPVAWSIIQGLHHDYTLFLYRLRQVLQRSSRSSDVD